jgi:hypothetical protein
VSYEFRPAKRENVPLLLGLAGGTGSGKTYSALLLARGMAHGEPFAIIDTENGRAKHYADAFPDMRWAGISAPFRPETYANAIEAADAEGFPVILVDSMSHEWAGDGGCLDWQEELMRGQESRRLMSWIEPKKAHKRMVTRLLQVRAHVILCFRAEPKVEMIDDPEHPGRKKFIEKRSVTGLHGWIPISEKMLPYELTASFLLMAEAPGVPRPIKLQEQHRPFFPEGQKITEEAGAALAKWAAGGEAPKARATAKGDPEPEQAPEPGSEAEQQTFDDAPISLTKAEFDKRAAAAFIPPPRIGALGKQMFPGKSLAKLTDEQRGELLAALLAETEAVAT